MFAKLYFLGAIDLTTDNCRECIGIGQALQEDTSLNTSALI